MTCERFQVIAGEVARNEIMDADERNKALAHTTACERCEQALASQNQLSKNLRSLAQEMKATEAPHHLEEKVLAAFREARVRSASRSRRPYWVAAAAAVLLLAIGLPAWLLYVSSVSRPNEQVGAQKAIKISGERSPDAVVSPTRPPDSATGLTARRIHPRRRQMTEVAKLSEKRSTPEPSPSAKILEAREIATDFMPVGYGSALDLQEGGQLVRVELPRSALSRFGLPMNIDRADERITADVLIGADGLARAIRFIQPMESTTGIQPEK